MIQETMTARERLEAAINLQEPDRVPVCPMIVFAPARHAGMTIEEFLNNPEAAVEAQHQFFDDSGGWDVMMMAGANDLFPWAFATPLRVKLPGQELPPDSIYQFDEAEVMLVDDYDIIIDKGWNHYMFKHLLPRIRPGIPRGLLERMKAIAKLVTLNRGMKKDIKYWEPRGVPTLVGAWMGLPFEMFSLARSLSQFTLDLYRRPEKVIAAMDAALPDILHETRRTIKATGIAPGLCWRRTGCRQVYLPSAVRALLLPVAQASRRRSGRGRYCLSSAL